MIQRERYIDKIKPFIGKDIIKVLTGIRRSGKSVMLRLIQDEIRSQGIADTQFISFNFESLENAEFCTADSLYQELKKRISSVQGKVYLFLDEIQEVEQWEKCINSVRVDFDCDIYITGSNAKLLSGELATYLGGRYVEFVIFPFSFEEYLVNLRYDKDASMQYLRDIYNSVLLKDVVQRNNIRDVELLERMILYLLDNVGHSFSARSISNYLKQENRKVSAETILNYIKACCDAYLFIQLRREDLQGKKILSVNEKYYSVDHGLRESILGTNARNIDQILENIVCMELLRRGYTVTIGKNGEKEIDFVAKKNKDKLYIQVAYLLAGSGTIEREFGIYDSIRDHYPKYVLSLDEFDMSRDGIKHLNIRDFLLSKEF